ncbi:type IV pilus secretin PilQ [Thermodesulfatator autotrophicus]|uniref:Secretin/TonB short N-terminal domain-containing protein n=1 Tax=Thermodesulfatator autotrophicus TaxID=1795632 RepID=A0A177E734_9BACT|nr:type IV pilus secretin PilQ [Thermodesulfatator autotrophicus]OAG27598.1 hypothetical protein TH606_06055 [Thermodesulfatator autotrophicus]
MYRIIKFLLIFSFFLTVAQISFASINKIVDISFYQKDKFLSLIVKFENNAISPEISSEEDKIILSFNDTKLLSFKDDLPEQIKKISFELRDNKLYIFIYTNLKVLKDYIKKNSYVLQLAKSSDSEKYFPYNLPPEPKNIEIPFEKKEYSGKKISLDLQDADIRTVFRMLSEIGGLNIVLGEDIQGKITLKIKDVPWDQVLDIIMAKFGLGKTEINNILYVAPLAKLQKQVEEIKKLRSSMAETQELGPTVTEYIKVNYINACDLLSQEQERKRTQMESSTVDDVTIKKRYTGPSILPLLSKKGSISCDSRTSMLIVKDIPDAINEIKKLLKKIDVPTKQVLMEARIVEVSSNFARNLGIQWFGGYYKTNQETSFRLSPNQSSGTDVTSNPFGSIVDLGVPANTNLGIAIGHITETSAALLDLRLSALEQQGLGKIVSAPVVITRDNGEAVIKQGYQIPYLELTSDGTATTKFINADLTLKVTPHILPNNEIRLEVTIDKSEPDWTRQVNNVPTIISRKVKTYVRVPNNGTVVIGGLKISKKQEAYDRVPGLSKIPGAGNLFKNSQKTQEDQELLIFITAKVVSSAVEDVDY